MNSHWRSLAFCASGRLWLGAPAGALLPRSNARPPLGVALHAAPLGAAGIQGSYLVDSASSYMLVLKIKLCMSKYKQLYRETANSSLNQLSFI
jgi:hypothetical protein